MKTFGTIGLAGALVVALAGCAQHPKTPVVTSAYPATPQMAPTPAYPPVSPASPSTDATTPDADMAPPAVSPTDVDAGGSRELAAPHRSVVHAARPASSRMTHAAASKGHTYVVKKGDTLSKIAKAHYGSTSSSTIRKIVAANPSLKKNRNLIKVGQKLNLP